VFPKTWRWSPGALFDETAHAQQWVCGEIQAKKLHNAVGHPTFIEALYERGAFTKGGSLSLADISQTQAKTTTNQCIISPKTRK